MANQGYGLTAAHIKYLLSFYELSKSGKGIRCVDVADLLGITKASVHTMMNTLKDMKLIKKDRYSEAHFTQEGLALTKRYFQYFKTVCVHLNALLPSHTDIPSAACALLAKLSPEDLVIMCDRMEEEESRIPNEGQG